MILRLYIVFLCLGFVVNSYGQNEAYQKMSFEKEGERMPYRLLLPKNYDTAKTYPLILVLHGSGERGSDNELQLTHGASLFLEDVSRKKYPAVVVFPQCAKNSNWATIKVTGEFGNRAFMFYKKGEPTKDMLLLEGLLKHLRMTYAIDKDRMYVGGLSMGGMGTFELVRRNPKMFAAGFPICGGANTAIANRIKRTRWWVFHGEADDVVPSKYSTEMVDALRTAGADVQYSLYPDVKHDSWNNAFAEPELLPWLFSISK